MARIEPQSRVLKALGQRECLLREDFGLGKPPRLATVFGGVDRDQAEAARIGDRRRGGLRLSQMRQHLFELTEAVQRPSKLEMHIDLLLARFARRGHVAQRLQGVLQIGDGLLVHRSGFGFDRGLPEIYRGPVPYLGAAKVIRDQLDDVLDSPRIEVFEAASGRAVILTSPALENARIDNILGERVLEAIHGLRVVSGAKNEVEAMELC